MTTDLISQILLGISDEPKLIPGASSLTIRANIDIPESWLSALSSDNPSSKTLRSIWKPLED